MPTFNFLRRILLNLFGKTDNWCQILKQESSKFKIKGKKILNVWRLASFLARNSYKSNV